MRGCASYRFRRHILPIPHINMCCAGFIFIGVIYGNMSKTIELDITVVALIMGLIAVVVIFVPLAVLLMGVFAFVIGLLKFYNRKNDILALIAMILGLVVIIVAVWQNM